MKLIASMVVGFWILLVATVPSVSQAVVQNPADAGLLKPAALAPQSEQVDQQMEELKTQVEVLKAQLAATRQFRDQLLTVVCWSIATIAAIAALHVVYSWFIKNRVYERDKESLAQALKVTIDQRLREMNNFYEFESPNVHNDRKLLANRNAQDSDLAKDVTKRLNELAEMIPSAVDRAMKKQSAKLEELNQKVHLLKIDFLTLECDERRSKQLFRDALHSSSQILDEALEIGSDREISNALESISTDLSSVIARNDLLDTQVKQDLLAKLGAVVGPQSEVAQDIKKLVAVS
jgi:hypothetical protein